MKGEAIGSFGFAVKKGSGYDYLIDDFNTALADMKADGTYQAIMAKWLGTDDKATTSQATGDPTAKATPVKASYKIVSDSSLLLLNFKMTKANMSVSTWS